MICLKKILDITWQKHIPDTKVLTRTSLPCIYTILMQSQLCWTSHVVHMKDPHLPNKLIFGELFQGKHSKDARKSASKTHWISLKSFRITFNCLEYLSQDRDKWCEVIKHGVKVCETRSNAVTELHRRLRKGTVTSTTAPPFLVLTAQDSSAHRLVSLANQRTHRYLPKS